MKKQSDTGSKVRKSEKAGSSSQYLRKNLKTVLPRALHDVCQARPADPIEYLAKCLYKMADSDLYFQDKAAFEREKHKMELKLKTEDTKRQDALERYKRHIYELKACIQKEEAARRASSTKPWQQGRKQRSRSASRRWKLDLRVKAFPGAEHLGKSFTSEPSESVHSSSSTMTIPTPLEQKTLKQLPSRSGSPQAGVSVARTGTAETRSIVSVRKDSSSTSHDALERSPSMRSSSSRAVSRMSYEGEGGLKDSIRKDTLKSKGARKGKKLSEDELPHFKLAGLKVPEDIRPKKKKSELDDSLLKLSASIVPGDLRDQKSHEVISTSDEMQKTQKIKRITSKSDRHESILQVSPQPEETKDSKKSVEAVDVSEIDASVSSEYKTDDDLLSEETETTESEYGKRKRKFKSDKRHTDSDDDEFSLEESELDEAEDGDSRFSAKRTSKIDKTEDEDSRFPAKKTTQVDGGVLRYDRKSADVKTADKFDKIPTVSKQITDRKPEILGKRFDGEEQGEEGIPSHRKKSKKKGKEKESKFVISSGEQEADESEQQDDKQLGLQTKLKKKKLDKKKRGKGYSMQPMDSEETEDEEETITSRSDVSIADDDIISFLQQKVSEDQGVDHVALQARKKDKRKSSSSYGEDDEKPATREGAEKIGSLDRSEEDEKPVRRKGERKKRQSPAIIIDVVESESKIESDSEKRRKTSSLPGAESAEHKRRVKRRIKKQDRISDEDETGLSPLQSYLPSLENSTDDFNKLGPKRGKGVSPKKSSKKSTETVKGARSRERRSSVLSRMTSPEDRYNESSHIPDGSLESIALDHILGIESASTIVITEEESLPFTPVECEWFLVGPQTLVCRHPVLGDIRSRPVVAVQSFYGWPDRLNYNWRAFYDPEVYTVVEPFASDKYKRRQKDL